MNKEKLETEKLELEIKSLKLPAYKKPTFWISLVGLLLALVGVIAQGTISRYELAVAEDKQREALEEVSIAKKQQISALELKNRYQQDITKLDERKKNLENEIQFMQSSINNLRIANEKLVSVTRQKASSVKNTNIVNKAENAKYFMALYALNVGEQLFSNVINSFIKSGYSLGYGGILSERYSWVAKESTVFYYHPESKNFAEKLAIRLRHLTGNDFTVSRGAGLGVQTGQERWTFYVHIIG